MKTFKRIAALATVILIVLLIIAALVVAFLDIPDKLPIFTGIAAGMVFLPIFAWLFLMFAGMLTGKKNIASFRSEEMEKTMAQAAQIKEERARAKAAQQEKADAGTADETTTE